jgi:CHAT domain-containing protein
MDGWATAMNDLARPSTVGELLARLEAAVHNRDWASVTALRNQVTALPRGVDPLIRVIMLDAVANALVRNERGTRADNLEEAIGLLHHARELVPPMHAGLSSVAAYNLGELYLARVAGQREENLRQARLLADEAVRIVSKLAYPEEWAAGKGLAGRCDLAWAEQHTDGTRSADIERAITFLRQGAQALERLSRNRVWVLLKVELARAYIARVVGGRPENIETALECCCDAFDGMDEKIDTETRSAVLQQRGLAYAERHYGDRRENLDRARTDLTEALRARLRGTEGWATTTTNLANVLAMLGDHSTAAKHYVEALTVRTPANFPSGWAQTTDSLATVEASRRDGDRGANLQRAINLWRQVLDIGVAQGESLFRARILEKIGTAHRYLAETDPPRRRDHLWQAAVALTDAMVMLASGDAPVDALRVAGKIAQLNAAKGSWEIAAEAYRFVIIYLEQLYRSAILDRGREQELAASDGQAREAAYVFARCGALDEAVEVIERFRARRLGDVLARDRAELADLTVNHPQLADRYSAVVTALRVAENQELACTGSPGHAARSNERMETSTWADRVAALRVELDRVVAAIREIPGQERFLTAPDLAEVAAVVQPHRPLAYILPTDVGTVALVVSTSVAGVLHIEDIWANRLTTADATEMLPFVLGDRDINPEIRATREVSGLDRLGDEVARPLAAHLEAVGASTVVLIACGRLGALPVHAAPYTKQDGSSTCLIEHFVVHFAPSARSLGAATRARHRPVCYLGVGNPTTVRARALRCAEAEVDEAMAAFPVHVPRDKLLGSEATRLEVLRRLPGPLVLHLACHGLADPSEPLSSRLLLAGDDVLTARDLMAAPAFDAAATLLTDVRLVLATACQSAVIDTVRVPDEVVGLPSALLLAGACGVIGTLWSVDDCSTAILVTKLSEILFRDTDPKKAREPADALAVAQAWLRKLTGSELVTFVSRHPNLAMSVGPLLSRARDQPKERLFHTAYHWAPFVYVGA